MTDEMDKLMDRKVDNKGRELTAMMDKKLED